MWCGTLNRGRQQPERLKGHFCDMFCDILLLDGARSTQFTSSDDLTEVTSSVMNQYLCEILEGSYERLGWFPGDVLKLVSSKRVPWKHSSSPCDKLNTYAANIRLLCLLNKLFCFKLNSSNITQMNKEHTTHIFTQTNGCCEQGGPGSAAGGERAHTWTRSFKYRP